ncbi:MAG TPA: NnrS family protein, partial [Burkholderiales bacterium]|nr:NnrS family protein [Burkholderiales bacterium]
AFSVLLWAAQFSGYLPSAYLQGPVWHGHEMLFGYTTAVIAGFLLTAVRAWTNQPTASGVPLMALAALWVCGRVLVLTPLAMTAAVVNAAFPVAIAVAIGIPLFRSRNVRNYFFVGLLVLMGVLILAVHLALQGRFELSPRFGLQLALDVVLFIMVVMGGRVIPMFTNNGVPGANAKRHALLEKFALGTVILLFAADLLQLPQTVIATIALIGALAHGMRLYLWKPWRTLAAPLVWILHAAYAWIVMHLALRGLSALELLAGSYATHALTVGAIGGLTLGMMTRTARGHTGRPLIADGFELTVFLLIQIAAIVRVFGGMASPALYLASVQLSALLWSAAFALYAVRYWPILSRPRLDGKPG